MQCDQRKSNKHGIVMSMPRPTPQQETKQQTNIIMGLFIGLVLGLGLALAVAIYINFSTLPFLHEAPKPIPLNATAPQTPGKPVIVQGVQLMNNQPTPPSPVPPSVERIEPTDTTENYQFYNMLTKSQSPIHNVSNTTEAPAPQQPTIPPTSATQPSPWPAYIIAGECHTPSEADDLRAQLALSGIEASVISIPDHQHYLYVVQLGPFSHQADLNRMLTTLAPLHLPIHVHYHTPSANPYDTD